MMSIRYRDPAFYWTRRHVKNNHEIDLPTGFADDRMRADSIAARAYLQGRADALAERPDVQAPSSVPSTSSSCSAEPCDLCTCGLPSCRRCRPRPDVRRR